MSGPGHQTDFQLIQRYRRGAPEAMEELVERYQQRLFGFVCKATASRQEAEEIYQETWLRIVKNIGRYHDQCFSAWLFRIARNLMIDRRRAWRDIASLDRPNETGGTLQDILPDAAPGPDVRVAERDLRARLEDAARALPAEQREVFQLRLDGGLSFKEIAAVQGVSINTALARMQYALVKLRSTLKLDD